MIACGGLYAVHPGHGLVPRDEDVVDVVGPGALGRLELDDVPRQVGVAVVGRLPAQLDHPSGLVQHL